MPAPPDPWMRKVVDSLRAHHQKPSAGPAGAESSVGPVMIESRTRSTAPPTDWTQDPKVRAFVDRAKNGPPPSTLSRSTLPRPRPEDPEGAPVLEAARGMSNGGRVVVETDDHFHVTDHRGSFKVAKAGLDDATHQKIRGMCNGGQVQGYADGGQVTPQDLALLDQEFPAQEPGMWDAPPQSGLLARGVRGLANLVDDPTRHEWWDAPGSTTPEGAAPPPAPDRVAVSNQAMKMLPPRSAFEAGLRGVKPALTTLDQPQQPTAPPTAQPPPRGGGGGISGLDPRELEMAKATQMQAGQAEQTAIGQQGQAESAAAQARAEALKAKAAGEADLLAQQQRMAADHQQALAAQMTAYQQAVDEYGRATVDPNRYWANASTGQKVLAGIGLVLGAFGAGNDGVNKSVAVINQAIDRDIDAQKERNAILGRKAEMTRGILGAMRETFQDDALALQATGDAYRQHAATLMEEMATRTQDPVRQAQLKATAAGLLQSRAQERLAMVAGFQAKAAEIAAANQRNALGWAKLRAAQGAKGGGKQMTAEQQGRLAMAQNAMGAVQTLRKELNRIGKGVSPSALLPGTPAARFEDKRRGVAGDIAKFLFPTQRGHEVIEEAIKLMPGVSDSAARQEEKLQLLETLIANRHRAEIGTMGQAGFNTSGFTGPAQASSSPAAVEEDDE